MQSVCILVALNKWRLSNELPEIALGPIELEMENITIAQKSYETSPRKSKMFKFLLMMSEMLITYLRKRLRMDLNMFSMQEEM